MIGSKTKTECVKRHFTGSRRRPVGTGCFLILLAMASNAIVSGQDKFEFGGQLRTRGLGQTNRDFNADRLDNTFFVQSRLRLNMQRQISDKLDILVEIQDSRLWGESGSTLDPLSVLDLHQAYVTFAGILDLPVQLRLGRQALSFGRGRLVGEYDWHQIGRAFDAGRLTWQHGEGELNLWLAQIRDLNADHISRNQEFAGAYLSTGAFDRGGLDFYTLFLFDGRNYDSLTDLRVPIARSDEGSNHLKIWTFGTRAELQLGAATSLEAEMAYQLGQRGPLDVRAYGLAVELAVGLRQTHGPVLSFGYTLGSGDSDPADDKLGTFNSLFPDVHGFLGQMDRVTWSNISAVHLGVAHEAAPWTLSLDLHLLSLADDQDAWYQPPGYLTGSPEEIYRRAVPGMGVALGHEIDFEVSYRFPDGVSLQGGLGFFSAGEFTLNTGGLQVDDSLWGYLSLSTDF